MNSIKDIKIGDVFGNLKVIKIIPPQGKIKMRVECVCEKCGNNKILLARNLLTRKDPTCGCSSTEKVDEKNIQKYIGRKFGRLTIIKYIPRENKKERLKVECLCDCGNKRICVFKSLRSGIITTCGCNMDKVKEYCDSFINKKYNRLTIVKFVGSTKHQKRLVQCKCDCGNNTTVTLTSVTNGYVKSCGCLQKEAGHKMLFVDGRTKERLHSIYWGMKDRCYNSHSDAYKHYGERGIKVCDEWLEDYLNFKKWALNNGYSDELSIDRINVNGNYEPSNCRWATIEQQAMNKRNTLYITYNNETKTLKEWCDIYKLNYRLVLSRIHKNKKGNKSIEEIFFAPKKEEFTLTYNNEKHTLKEWSAIMDISYDTILERYKKKYLAEDILYKGILVEKYGSRNKIPHIK